MVDRGFVCENHRCALRFSTAPVLARSSPTQAVLHPRACTKQKPKELDPELKAGAVEVRVCFLYF